MKNHITQKIILTFLASLFLFSCSKKNNDIDFDFTTLKKPQKTKVIDIKKETNPEDKKYIRDLTPLKDKKEVLAITKFGKRDPFSKSEAVLNKLNLDFKLIGFLNTEINKFAFVSYKDKEGTISEDSVGGVNTKLLPDGAKVLKLDPKNMKLIINFEDKNFIFEM